MHLKPTGMRISSPAGLSPPPYTLQLCARVNSMGVAGIPNRGMRTLPEDLRAVLVDHDPTLQRAKHSLKPAQNMSLRWDRQKNLV